VLSGPNVTVVSLDDNLALALADDDVLVVVETELLGESSAEFGFSLDTVEDSSSLRINDECVEESANSVNSDSVFLWGQKSAASSENGSLCLSDLSEVSSTSSSTSDNSLSSLQGDEASS